MQDSALGEGGQNAKMGGDSARGAQQNVSAFRCMEKARKLGNLRENGNVRWFVPQIVQDQLDRFLARSTMGISNVTGRNEEVLIEQLASTASAMCKEYNIGLEKARFPVELSFRFFVSPDRHHA